MKAVKVKPDPHLSEHDVNLLRPYVDRLAAEIDSSYGSPGFPEQARALASAIRREVGDETIASTNGYVPLCTATDGLILRTLQELARERTQEILERLRDTLEDENGRTFPSDCERLERNALVHGALLTFNSRSTRGGHRR
jgi:hypothetical protein